MSTEYVESLTIHDSAVMPPSYYVDAPIASGTRIFKTINKTWHANCSATAVSKILDWLVK